MFPLSKPNIQGTSNNDLNLGLFSSMHCTHLTSGLQMGANQMQNNKLNRFCIGYKKAIKWWLIVQSLLGWSVYTAIYFCKIMGGSEGSGCINIFIEF